MASRLLPALLLVAVGIPVGAMGVEGASCVPVDGDRRSLVPPLRLVRVLQGPSLIMGDWDWRSVDPRILRVARVPPPVPSDGTCGDHPGVAVMAPEPLSGVVRSGVRVQVEALSDAGSSGRGWPGGQCSYSLSSADGRGARVELGPAQVPPFNELTSIERQGMAAWVSLQHQGYPRDFPAGGNRVIALDLCLGSVRWQTPDGMGRGPIMVLGDYLLSTEGFTDTPAWLWVLDRRSGAEVQQLPLPTGALEIAVALPRLYVKTHDALAVFDVLVAMEP